MTRRVEETGLGRAFEPRPGNRQSEPAARKAGGGRPRGIGWTDPSSEQPENAFIAPMRSLGPHNRCEAKNQRDPAVADSSLSKGFGNVTGHWSFATRAQMPVPEARVGPRALAGRGPERQGTHHVSLAWRRRRATAAPMLPLDPGQPVPGEVGGSAHSICIGFVTVPQSNHKTVKRRIDQRAILSSNGSSRPKALARSNGRGVSDEGTFT
jgi:hypothetical protein